MTFTQNTLGTFKIYNYTVEQLSSDTVRFDFIVDGIYTIGSEIEMIGPLGNFGNTSSNAGIVLHMSQDENGSVESIYTRYNDDFFVMAYVNTGGYNLQGFDITLEYDPSVCEPRTNGNRPDGDIGELFKTNTLIFPSDTSNTITYVRNVSRDVDQFDHVKVGYLQREGHV